MENYNGILMKLCGKLIIKNITSPLHLIVMLIEKTLMGLKLCQIGILNIGLTEKVVGTSVFNTN